MRDTTFFGRTAAEIWALFRNAAIGLGLAVCAVLVVASALALLAAWSLGFFNDHSPTTSIVSEFPSPDGVWKVVVDETIYDLGLSSDVECGIGLVPAREPAHRMEMLTTGWESCYAGWPRIVWTQPSVVQVTLRNYGYPVIHSLVNDGVRAEIRFAPPEPPVFPGWRKTLELPAAQP